MRFNGKNKRKLNSNSVYKNCYFRTLFLKQKVQHKTTNKFIGIEMLNIDIGKF